MKSVVLRSRTSVIATPIDETDNPAQNHLLTSVHLPLPRKKHNTSPRLFIIRGDLKSCTGYGKATQSLAAVLADQFDVAGVDIHHNPADADGHFPFPILKDADIPALIARHALPPIILNYTTPETYRYYPGAVNIGSFYWETDAIPFRAGWADLIQSMDHMWAPTSYVAELVRSCGYTGSVTLVTWPHEFQAIAGHNRADLRSIRVIYVSAMTRNAESRTVAPSQLRRSARNVFLAVQSLAPRKGLPILLSEWRDYVASKPTDDILLLKLRFIHSSRIDETPVEHLHEVLEEAGFRNGDPVRIAMIPDDLSEAATQSLYGIADAYITATYGEGFGGPIAEALCHHRLVIAPRHTGMTDLLSPDYPLSVDHVPLRVGLRGISNIYPHSSVWRLPKRGAIKAAIETFTAMSTEERAAILLTARSHLANFCSTATVRTQLSSFFDRLPISEADAT
jgi:hypothetical protein